MCVSYSNNVLWRCDARRGMLKSPIKSALLVLFMTGIIGLCTSWMVLAEEVSVDPQTFQVRQGEIVEIVLSVPSHATSAEGTWRGKNIQFFKIQNPPTLLGLVGVDLDSKVGASSLKVTIVAPQWKENRKFIIEIVDASFPVQTLQLPRNMVDLDADTLNRVRKEAKHLRTLFAQTNTPRAWTDNFIVPLKGKISGAFGRRRIINGQKKNPHTGEDISAPQGAEVQASNRGIVRLATEQFFSGKSILIDHGLGLFTMYFHLSEMLVKEGNTVERGEMLGLVGSTGRATGPHLHWGARLNNARVDPYELIRMKIGASFNGGGTQ